MAKKIEDGLTPQKRYEKKNIVTVSVKFNRNTDSDLLELLDSSGNKQGLIKKALREFKR